MTSMWGSARRWLIALAALLVATILPAAPAHGVDHALVDQAPRPRIDIIGGRVVVGGRPLSIPPQKLRFETRIPQSELPALPPVPRASGAATASPSNTVPTRLSPRKAKKQRRAADDFENLLFAALPDPWQSIRLLTVGGNVNASNVTSPQFEATIAVNPRNPQNLVLGSDDVVIAPVRGYRSTDAGASWSSQSLPLPATYGYASDPVVAADLNGNLYTAYLGVASIFSSIDILVSKSTDGGNTWATPKNVTTSDVNDREWLAVDIGNASVFKGNLYVVWQIPGFGVHFSRSTDGGTSFSAPTRIDVIDIPTDATGSVIYTMVTVAPNGDVYVAWEDYNGISNVPSGLFMRRSADAGSTWGGQVRITTTNLKTFDPGTFIPANANRGIGPIPALAVDAANVLHFTYGDRGAISLSDNNTDIYYRRSLNFGQTWSSRVKLNDDNTTTSQFYAWPAVDPWTDTLHVVWYDARNDPTNNKAVDVYYTRSTYRGEGFEPNLRVTSVSSDETQAGANFNQFGDLLGLAAYCGSAYAAWTDSRLLSTKNEEIFTSVIRDTTPGLPGMRCGDTISITQTPNTRSARGSTSGGGTPGIPTRRS